MRWGNRGWDSALLKVGAALSSGGPHSLGSEAFGYARIVRFVLEILI